MSSTPQPIPHWSPEAADGLGPSSPRPLLWSPAEAAKRLGIGQSTLYELLASGQLASLKIGARRLIPDEACRKFIAARLAETAEW